MTLSNRRRAGWFACTAACIALLAGCGDDAEDSFCEAGDSLRANVAELRDVDIIGEGTSALDEPLDAIRSDVRQLRDSGSEVAADEIAALETALDDLTGALGADGASVDIGAAVTAAGEVLDAAGAVFERLATACD